MLLVVDADVLVGQLTNRRGRELILYPSLRLYMTAEAWREAQHELPKRTEAMIRRGARTPEEASLLLAAAVETAHFVITGRERQFYAHEEANARVRVIDQGDLSSLALALALDAAIWTNDRHFFGCGCPVWRTDSLRAALQRTDVKPQ